MKDDEDADVRHERINEAFLLPVKCNLATMKSVATSRKEKRGTAYAEWFFGLGPAPKLSLWTRLKILPWSIIDHLAVAKERLLGIKDESPEEEC